MKIRVYNVCAIQLQLSEYQKADFFVNVFSGPARTFFFENARNDMTYDDVATLIVQEYDSDARQLQVHSELDNLRLDVHMAEKGITEHSAGLTSVVHEINALTPQCSTL